MFGRRTPMQLAAGVHVRRSRKRGPEAVARAERLKAEVDAEAKRST